MGNSIIRTIIQNIIQYIPPLHLQCYRTISKNINNNIINHTYHDIIRRFISSITAIYTGDLYTKLDKQNVYDVIKIVFVDHLKNIIFGRDYLRRRIMKIALRCGRIDIYNDFTKTIRATGIHKYLKYCIDTNKKIKCVDGKLLKINEMQVDLKNTDTRSLIKLMQAIVCGGDVQYFLLLNEYCPINQLDTSIALKLFILLINPAKHLYYQRLPLDTQKFIFKTIGSLCVKNYTYYIRDTTDIYNLITKVKNPYLCYDPIYASYPKYLYHLPFHYRSIINTLTELNEITSQSVVRIWDLIMKSSMKYRLILIIAFIQYLNKLRNFISITCLNPAHLRTIHYINKNYYIPYGKQYPLFNVITSQCDLEYSSNNIQNYVSMIEYRILYKHNTIHNIIHNIIHNTTIDSLVFGIPIIKTIIKYNIVELFQKINNTYGSRKWFIDTPNYRLEYNVIIDLAVKNDNIPILAFLQKIHPTRNLKYIKLRESTINIRGLNKASINEMIQRTLNIKLNKN